MQRIAACMHRRKENTRASARKSTILVVAVERRNLKSAGVHAKPGTATSVLAGQGGPDARWIAYE
jgi:hypothetical protein